MSSIGPNIPGSGVVPTPATPVVQPAASAPAPTAPTYLQSFSGASTAVALGLSAPRNLGDIEALFAEIATKLDVTRNTNDDNEFVAKSDAKRTEMGRLASLITMVANFATILAVEEQVQVPRQNRGAAAAARDAAQAQADTFDGRIALLDDASVSDLGFASQSGRPLRGSIGYETGQRDAAAGTLSGLVSVPQGSWPTDLNYTAGLNFFLANANQGASPADVRTAYTNWYNSRLFLSNAQAERSDLVAARDAALVTVEEQQAEYELWDAVAAPLEARINAARSNLPAATTAEAGSSSFLDLLLFFAALLPTVLGALLNQRLDLSDTGGQADEIVSDVEQNLKDTIEQIREVDYERLELQFMSRMSAGDPGSGVSADASGTAFGGLTRAEAAAMAFGGLILGTIEGLGQVAGQGSGPFASAGSLAEAGAPRTRVAL